MSLGPGAREYMVPRALELLKGAEVVVGYRTYLDLIRDLIEGKEVLASGMRKEVERCRAALHRALQGADVALVSSGDAGIYGMAGLVYELCRAEEILPAVGPPEAAGDSRVEIEVVPGVAAFNAAASLLGAPLMHDFAAISLSDHLTPWEMIEKRLQLAGEGDFVVALYNPRSKSRPGLLEKAIAVIGRYRPGRTPVGIVRKAMREGQRCHLVTLGTVPVEEVDMQSILIIGNSRSYTWGDLMITPRGYDRKYQL